MFFYLIFFFFFFFNDTATTEIYTLSLHDALPICDTTLVESGCDDGGHCCLALLKPRKCHRSEEHTSELQSQFHLVCRLLLEKKKKIEKKSQASTTTHRKKSKTN